MLKRDLFESTIDIGSGFFITVFIQLLIFPLFGLHPTVFDSIGIALIFMVISIGRSALWRIYFRRRNDLRNL